MKKTNKNLELMLPFEFLQTTEEYEARVINIRFSGEVLGEYKVGDALYDLKDPKMYSNGDYEQIVDMLKNNENKKIRVLFKTKEGKAIDFKIDLDSLVSIYNDDRLANLELLSCGLNEIISSEKVLNKKIVLGPNKITRTVLNIATWIIVILVFLLNLVCLFDIYLFIVICPLSIIFLVTFCNYLYTRIEIENSIITKTNLFNRRKVLGNMSLITSYTINLLNIIVFSNNKKIFSFNPVGEDNFSFREYLKNNYEFSICVFGNKVLSYFCYGFGILFMVMMGNFNLLGVIFLCIGLDESLKEFQIIGDMITYKRLFVNKKINLSSLNEIKYYKEVGYGRYRGRNCYDIIGYDDNGAKSFKIKEVTPETLEHLINTSKKYGIKVRKI